MDYNKLMDKMCNVVKSANDNQGEVVARYLSLGNRQLHKAKGDQLWRVIHGSFIIKYLFENKFGTFIQKKRAISS